MDLHTPREGCTSRSMPGTCYLHRWLATMPKVTMLSIKKYAGELEQLVGPAPSIAEGRGRARPAI